MFAYMGRDYRPIYIFDDIDEGMRLLDRHHKQIIIFDDFLGQIRLDASNLGRRDQRIETLVHIVEKSPNTRFIMTTREYILRQAQAISDRLSSPGFQIMRYVLDVGKYTRLVRAKILYNHLYFSELPKPLVLHLVDSRAYIRIVDHNNFNPRVISWLADTHYIGAIREPSEYPSLVLNILDHPRQLWAIAVRKHLSRAAQTLLLTVASVPERTSLKNVQRIFDVVHGTLSQNLNHMMSATDFVDSLKELEGSFIGIQSKQVQFLNPSFREFMEDELLAHRLEAQAVMENLRCVAQLRQLAEVIGNREEAKRPTGIGRWVAHGIRALSEEMSKSEWQLDEFGGKPKCESSRNG